MNFKLKTLKKLLLTLFISSSLFAQEKSNQLGLMFGNKSAEISVTHTDEIIYGFSISGTDSKLVENRANKNSLEEHKLLAKYTPAVYALIGGDFGYLSMMAKLGACYINQSINGTIDSKKIYLAVGMVVNIKATDLIGIRASFDNVSGAMIGATFNFR